MLYKTLQISSFCPCARLPEGTTTLLPHHEGNKTQRIFFEPVVVKSVSPWHSRSQGQFIVLLELVVSRNLGVFLNVAAVTHLKDTPCPVTSS